MRLLLFALAAYVLQGCSSDDSLVAAQTAADSKSAVDASAEVGLPAEGTPCNTAAECQDPNLTASCKHATCDLEKHICQVSDADDGDICFPGNACVGAGTCSGGKCVPGKVVVCVDNNSCTEDKCDPATGCNYQAVQQGAPCDDSNGCTVNDKCDGTKCKGVAADCDDKNPCTGDSCDPQSGECKHLPVNGPCDDGNPCTTESCANGLCAAAAINCDDGNQCTVDVCDLKFGGCISTNVPSGSCTDNNVCTTADGCKDGACLPGPPKNCDDNDVCTLDSCNTVSGCAHAKSTVITCDDGDKCTQNDYCGAAADGTWKCIQGKLLVCDDGNVCTDDACTPNGGCAHTPNNGACDDGNQCTTGDTCNQYSCQASKIQKCDDNNVCTTDTCTPLAGCIYSANTNSCDDGSLCTTDNLCANKVCVGTPVNCNDNNPCTKDTCDSAKGCTFTKLSAGTSCNDGDPCTSSETCDGSGKCLGKAQVCNDNNPCTKDTCVGGNCAFAPVANNTPCSDSDACTIADKCVNGACLPGSPTPCDDNNPCTTDGPCDPTTGKCAFAKIPGMPGCK